MPSLLPSKVNFFYDAVDVNIRQRKKLKKFVEAIFKAEGKRLNVINYIFCTDQKILEINRRYLKHNYYTDIITFDFSETSQSIISDVYISIDRVKENAVSHETLLKQEICRVIFHGALHLCGYRDQNARQKREMRTREEHYLEIFLKCFT